MVSIRDDLAAVAHRGRKEATVELLSLTTGKAQWTHTLAGRRPNVRGIALTAKRVFVRTGRWVEILDTTTGKPPVASATSGAALPAP